MTNRIVVIQGHPDAHAHHLGHELAASYRKGDEIGGHEVKSIDVHSLKSLERNILGFCGIGPIRTNLIGMVGDMHAPDWARWLKKMYTLGRAGE